MFFIVSKLLGFVAEPANFLVLAALVGVALAGAGLARLGRAVVFAAVIALAICLFSPLGALILRPLEDRFPRLTDPMPAPDGIIVLGGGLDPDLSIARDSVALLPAASRLTSAVALARRYPRAKVVFTGGSASLGDRGVDEAIVVRGFWESLGIPAARVEFEQKSRNTYENAVFTYDLVEPTAGQRWLLVTSAAHMPRAVGIFRRAGFAIIPYPVDYRTYGDARDWKLVHVGSNALSRLDVAAHEWAGLVAYRLTDKTDALFPGP